MNELSYLIYKLLKKENMPYKLIGEKWKILGSKYSLEAEKKLMVPDFSRYNIYADGMRSNSVRSITQDDFFERYEISQCLEVLRDIVDENYRFALNHTSNSLLAKGVKVYECNLPLFLSNLETHSEIEENIVERDLYLGFVGTKKYSSSDLEIINKIYGKEYVEKWEKTEGGGAEYKRFTKIIHGEKLSTVKQEQRVNHVYLIGPCIVAQAELMTKDTLIAHIQNALDQVADGVYKVCSVAIYFYRPHRLEDIINSLTIRENDVFIFLANGFEPHENIPFINIIEKYNLRASDELWFSNTPIHVNQIGSKMVADEVCEKFLNQVAIDYVNEGNNNPQKIIQFPKVISDENAVFTDEYIRQYAPKVLCNKIVGSIVMNCNPFTKGHEYLIEQSLTKVDYLYIFVVEEDKSYFSFEERMELVRRNMEKYENVIVLPSGKAILSMKTMSGYFMKETVRRHR